MNRQVNFDVDVSTESPSTLAKSKDESMASFGIKLRTGVTRRPKQQDVGASAVGAQAAMRARRQRRLEPVRLDAARRESQYRIQL